MGLLVKPSVFRKKGSFSEALNFRAHKRIKSPFQAKNISILGENGVIQWDHLFLKN